LAETSLVRLRSRPEMTICSTSAPQQFLGSNRAIGLTNDLKQSQAPWNSSVDHTVASIVSIEMQRPENTPCAPRGGAPRVTNKKSFRLSSPNQNTTSIKGKNNTEGGTKQHRNDLSIDEIQDSWWSAKEYHGIRLGAKFLTKDIRSRDKDLVTGIDEAYARALHLACSLSDEDFDDLVADCSSQSLCLAPWCARNLSARGLERYTSKKHRFERSEYATETRAAVLRLAQNKNVSANDLSVFYKEYARSAALYARFCGQADYIEAMDIVRGSSSLTPATEVLEVGGGGGSCIKTSLPTTAETGSPTSTATPPCPPPNKRDLLRRSKEPSRGRIMVRELSQRMVDTAV
jgi:hypothetical protein